MACLSYPGWWLIGGTWSLKKKAKKKRRKKKYLNWEKSFERQIGHRLMKVFCKHLKKLSGLLLACLGFCN